MQARKCVQAIAPYQPGRPISDVQRELGLDEVHKLASNENPLGPPASAVEAIRIAALNGSLYPDGYAYELRMALCERYGLKPYNLIFGDGSNEILKLLSLTYLERGDEVIVPSPSFSEYGRTAALCDAVVKEVPLTEEYRVDLPAMAAAVSSRTKFVYICNPNNPTGTVIDKRDLLKMIKRLGDDILFILDEAYFEYIDDPNSPDGVEFFREFSNVIVLRTFSKAFGLAGLRVGYGIAAKAIVDEMNKVREPFNVNSLALVAAQAALNDKEYLKKSVEYNKVERQHLYEEMTKMGLEVVPSHANFLLVDVGTNGRKLFDGLQRKGVIIRPADIFGYPNKIRVSVGLREENKHFLAALKEYLEDI